ncbi:MAG TPA: hypothetical protein VGS19_07975 [Streptosporangiaceae bacterium]|nr:hypothetical protein [Streptosporangiaceae bacterium]
MNHDRPLPRRARWLALVPLTTVMATMAVALTSNVPAQATIGTNDYPYANYAPDSSNAGGFPSRECTSFVAWRLNNDDGVPFGHGYQNQWWGDAYSWAFDSSGQLGG